METAVRRAWERFQLGQELSGVREEVLQSWRRSRLSGVDPQRIALPHDEPDTDSRFAGVAVPVLARMAELLVGTDTALALTNRSGQVVWRWVSDAALNRSLDAMDIVEGFYFDEEHAGTNGLGTSLENGRVVTIRGDEHFKEPFHRFTCAAGPVHHPLTRRAVGAVNVTCRAEHTTPLLAPTVTLLVREVQEALLQAAGDRERRLFDAFLAERAGTVAPVLVLGPDVLIANQAAAELGIDHHRWWSGVLAAVEDGGPVQLPELDARTATLRRVAEGGRNEGVVVTVGPRTPGTPGGPPAPSFARTPARRAADTVRRVLDTGGFPVVQGEPGTGRATLLREVCGERAPAVRVVDGAARPDWADDGSAVVLRNLERLPLTGAGSAELVAGLAAAASAGTLVAASVGATVTVEITELLDGLVATLVELPPLRARPEEITPLVQELSPPGTRWSAAALAVLAGNPWPGNVAELGLVVRRAVAAAAGRLVTVDHLPAPVRTAPGTRRRTLLERAEAAVIAEVLTACAGNKSAAARKLGLSRPTLYAKLRAYRI
ncbi:sigma-54-dependent Fis family transcriptional regulator [Modestobacter lapidis]|nr:hypothetical protein [Modestobacter lapidis]